LAPAEPLSFTEADVAAFAAASGDRNPLHVDRGYARTTPFGDRVVHGSLLTLAALRRLGDELAEVRALEVTFGGAVLVGEPVDTEVREAPNVDGWQVRVVGRGRLLARIVARRSGGEPDDIEVPAPTRPIRTEPNDPPAPPQAGDVIAGAYAAGGLPGSALAPALAEALAWASYVVGMEAPGLHGVFAALKLSLAGEGARTGAYALHVADYDPRTARLLLTGALDAASRRRVSAVIEAFGRPAVPELDASALVPAELPSATGRAVVVVGGSRGFGAATALALLGRGHETHVIHSSPARLPDERLHGHLADARDAEAMARVADEVAARGLALHGIVLAASPPPLPMAVTPSSAPAVADYVATALRLAVVPLGALLPLVERGGFVLFCSSTAVTAPPRDWPHYVAAKGALEGVAAWTAASTPGVRSVAARLPKMLTAMTNSPSMRVAAAAPEPVAKRLVELLQTDALQPGLTVLEEELL
jgi:NAD(P)-dependent dehydrogenase (short-subunit alcohol dehydrogenase family)/acyl dehydratase